MIAIITDTPGIARQIAHALNIEVTAGEDGYFRGYGFTLVWANGELLSLSTPENRLKRDDLPFIPESLIPAVRRKKIKKGRIANKVAVKQLYAIKKVFDECKSIIVATDAGEKGELHFRNIYTFLEGEKPFRRLWLDSLAPGAVREGFRNLGEGFLYDLLYAAADCRVKADYLTGVNAGRALGLATGLVNRPLGRLETPVLAMVCKRFAEYRKFVSVRFHEHRITLEKEGLYQNFVFPGSIKNKRKAEKIHERLKTFPTARVTKIDTRSRIQPVPLLYGLIVLQMDAHIRYGFSAAKTMETARKLYRKKLITHPLADSRHIPGSVFDVLPKILRRTAGYCGMTDKLGFMDMKNLNRRSVEEGNNHPAAHHAIIPSGIYPGYLPKEEKALYEMIVCRTLEAFAPDCRKEFIRVETAIDNFAPVSEKSRIIAPGWRSIQNREEDREWDEAAKENGFPRLTEGETIRISGYNLLARRTLPQPLHTEASLLAAMEEASLGTAEARTLIIESLFSSGYIERRGEFLAPTETGQAVFNCVGEMRISNIQTAGYWEKALAKAGKGEQSAEMFMAMFKIFIRQATEEILDIQKSIRNKRGEKER